MFNHLSVRARLLTGFLLVAILGAVVALIGIVNMAKMNDQAERAYRQDLLGISASKEANINLLYIARSSRNLMLARTPEERAKFKAIGDSARKKMNELLAVARPLFQGDGPAAMFAELDKNLADYDVTRAELGKLVEVDTPEGKNAAIDFAFGPLVQKATVVDDKLTQIGEQKEKE